MTGPEAAAFVEQQVEALFAASRDAVGDEIGPYTHLSQDGEIGFYPYVVFAGRGARNEMELPKYVENADEEARFIIAAVKERFPDHAAQRVIWRKRPAFEIIPAQKASRKFDIEASPAAQQIYCRLVGVPMDAEVIGPWREPPPYVFESKLLTDPIYRIRPLGTRPAKGALRRDPT